MTGHAYRGGTIYSGQSPTQIFKKSSYIARFTFVKARRTEDGCSKGRGSERNALQRLKWISNQRRNLNKYRGNGTKDYLDKPWGQSEITRVPQRVIDWSPERSPPWHARQVPPVCYSFSARRELSAMDSFEHSLNFVWYHPSFSPQQSVLSFWSWFSCRQHTFHSTTDSKAEREYSAYPLWFPDFLWRPFFITENGQVHATKNCI